MKKIFSILLIGFLIFTTPVSVSSSIKSLNTMINDIKINDDFDPLVDINITFDILAIRALKTIESNSKPDFFIKLIIQGEEFTSPIWENESYLYNCWSINKDVPDDIPLINISIELFDWNSDENIICDIGKISLFC